MNDNNVNIVLREWQLEDALDLTAAINNKKVLVNLRDGIHYPSVTIKSQ